MKREIKFRAWDRKDKKLYGPESIYDIVAGWDFIDLADNQILMQYTGLKDKNGKEIYEGDIVTLPIPETDYKTRETGEVVFWDVSGSWEIMHDGFRSLYAKESNQLEVIGNIYENPDLLAKDPS